MAATKAPLRPAGSGIEKPGAGSKTPDDSGVALWLQKIKSTMEHLGGMEDRPTPAWMNHALFWGIWWAALILIVLAFSGQTSKFIYIDF
jgi:hypothetical protein